MVRGMNQHTRIHLQLLISLKVSDGISWGSSALEIIQWNMLKNKRRRCVIPASSRLWYSVASPLKKMVCVGHWQRLYFLVTTCIYIFYLYSYLFFYNFHNLSLLNKDVSIEYAHASLCKRALNKTILAVDICLISACIWHSIWGVGS